MNCHLSHLLGDFSIQLPILQHTLQFFFFHLQLFLFHARLFSYKLKFPLKTSHFSLQIDNQLLLFINYGRIISL
jgi:hypothetical protein